jgi:Helicase associated domain
MMIPSPQQQFLKRVYINHHVMMYHDRSLSFSLWMTTMRSHSISSSNGSSSRSRTSCCSRTNMRNRVIRFFHSKTYYHHPLGLTCRNDSHHLRKQTSSATLTLTTTTKTSTSTTKSKSSAHHWIRNRPLTSTPTQKTSTTTRKQYNDDHNHTSIIKTDDDHDHDDDEYDDDDDDDDVDDDDDDDDDDIIDDDDDDDDDSDAIIDYDTIQFKLQQDYVDGRSEMAIKRWLQNFERGRLFLKEYQYKQQQPQQKQQQGHSTNDNHHPNKQITKEQEQGEEHYDSSNLIGVSSHQNMIPLVSVRNWLMRQRILLYHWSTKNPRKSTKAIKEIKKNHTLRKIKPPDNDNHDNESDEPIGTSYNQQATAAATTITTKATTATTTKKKNGKYHSIDDDRTMAMKALLLQSIGYSIAKFNEEYWDRQFRRLCQYVKEHNGLFPYHKYDHHNQLRQMNEDDQLLYYWCRRQRVIYRKYNISQQQQQQQQQQQHPQQELPTTNDVPTTATSNQDDNKNVSATSSTNYRLNQITIEQRIKKLEAIGFTWYQPDQKWSMMYQQLKLYYQHHGDCLVPKTYSDRSLFRWVARQRHKYVKFQKYHHHHQQQQQQQQQTKEHKTRMINKTKKDYFITTERIQLLNELNFAWDPIEMRWLMKYKELYHYIHHGVRKLGTLPSKRQHLALRRWLMYQMQLHHQMNQSNQIIKENQQKGTGEMIIVPKNTNDDIDGIDQHHPQQKQTRINSLTPHRIALLKKLGFLLS